MLGVDAGENPFDIRLDEGPGALVLGFFLTPDDLRLLEALKLLDEREGRERIELLDPHQVDVVDTAGVALFEEVVVDLARAKDDALDLLVGLKLGVGMTFLGVIPQNAVERRSGGEVLDIRDRHFVTQKRFRRHQDERLAVVAVQLAAQDVEVVRRCGAVCHDPVVAAAHLQEAFEAGGGVFRPLSLEAMRQEHHQTGHTEPFRLARGDELVEHDLGTVGEIAELGLPHHKGIWLRQRIAVFETQDRIFGEHRVDDLVLRLTLTDVVQRVVAFFGLLVDEGGVALREGAARAVLTGEADGVAFEHQ